MSSAGKSGGHTKTSKDVSSTTTGDAASATGSEEFIFKGNDRNSNLEAGAGDVVISTSYRVHTEDARTLGEDWEYGAKGTNKVVVHTGKGSGKH